MVQIKNQCLAQVSNLTLDLTTNLYVITMLCTLCVSSTSWPHLLYLDTRQAYYCQLWIFGIHLI